MTPPRRCSAILGAALLVLLVPSTVSALCESGVYYVDPQSMTTGANPHFSVLADFDADGFLDFAVTNSNFLGGGSPGIAVLRGNGVGGFGPPTTYPAGLQPNGLVTGDFNGDGALDLAAANKASGTISILLGVLSAGAPTGSFEPGATFPAGGLPFQLVTGDYNTDGILDLAAAINNAPKVNVFLGQGAGGVGDGSFASPQSYALAHLGVAIEQGDFDADGIIDLVASEYFAGTVAVLRGQGSGGIGNGTFAPAVHYPAGPEPFDIEVFDFDEDGILDLAVANSSTGGVRILRGLGSGGVGTGAFQPHNQLASGNTSTVLALDINFDGVIDLLTGDTTPGVGQRLHVYIGNGAGGVGNGYYTEAPPIILGSEPYQLSAGELGGNKTPEVLVSLYNTDQVVLLSGGCAGAPVDTRFPVLTDVRDVPEDQGGRVYLTWLRSSLDISGGAVTSYRVWRRIPPLSMTTPPPAELAARRTITTRSERGPGGEELVTYWESITTLPAERLEGYGFTAPTTEDSTAAHPVSTAFFISALTANINVSYPSNIDSGASIDNLPPGRPQDLRVGNPGATSFAMAWSPPGDADVAGYRVYRSLVPDFVSGEGTLLGAAADTVFEDTDAIADAYYRVTAVDVHGNEGPASASLARGVVSASDAAPRLALAGPWPNPARAGRATLALTLPGGSPARLEVFDVAGRRVASPSLAGLAPGRHAFRLGESRPLAPGIYWVRLSHGADRLERKMVVVD